MPTVTVDKSIDLDCSRHDAFEKLRRVDFYSQFTGIEQVQTHGANKAHIVETVGGQREEFDIELKPVPEDHIDYHIPGGAPMDGWLIFQPLDEQHTRLQFHAEYDPQQVSNVYHISQQELDQHFQERLEGMKSLAEGETFT